MREKTPPLIDEGAEKASPEIPSENIVLELQEQEALTDTAQENRVEGDPSFLQALKDSKVLVTTQEMQPEPAKIIGDERNNKIYFSIPDKWIGSQFPILIIEDNEVKEATIDVKQIDSFAESAKKLRGLEDRWQIAAYKSLIMPEMEKLGYRPISEMKSVSTRGDQAQPREVILGAIARKRNQDNERKAS